MAAQLRLGWLEILRAQLDMEGPPQEAETRGYKGFYESALTGFLIEEKTRMRTPQMTNRRRS